MPENGNPCASIVVEGCPSSKNAIFGSLKKNAIFGSQFSEGEKIVPPMDVGCFNPTNRVKWRAANKKYSRERMI